MGTGQAGTGCEHEEPPPLLLRCAAGNFACPSIIEWTEDTVKIAYTVWGTGIKLASVKLATVDSN